MKKFLSVLMALFLLCNLFVGMTVFAGDELFVGTACTLNPDGSVSVGNNGYYSQTVYTKFSEGESAKFTMSVDQLGDDWYDAGLSIIVNSTLQDSLHPAVWKETGADGVFSYAFQKNEEDMLGRIYFGGEGLSATAAADWLSTSLSGDITVEVKQNSNGVTALFLNGTQWVPYETTGISIPDGYLAIATSQGAKVTIKDAQRKLYGTNYLSNLTYEDGQTGIWTNTYGACQHRIEEGGYRSEHALHSALNNATGLNRLISSPLTIGDGVGEIPVDTWCTWSFKVRTTANTEVGLLAHADVKTTGNQSVSFNLSPVARTPLNGDNWVEMTMRFKLTINDSNQIVCELRRHDWSYILTTTPLQLSAGETFSTMTVLAQANDVDLWFDDVVLSYEVENEAIRPTLMATPSKVAAGEEFTVEYTLNNTGIYNIKEVPYTFEYNPLMVKPLTEVSGTMELPANGSQTVTARFQVLEGGAAVITAVSPVGIQEASTRVECTGRGYYFGDSHSHSTESDGKGTAYDNLKTLYDLGMSFNITADHNANVGDAQLLDRWNAALEQVRGEITNPDRYLNIVANENSKDWNHLLQYFGTKQYYTPYTIAGFQEIIAAQKSDGGLNFIAHPFLATTGQFWPLLKGPSVILPELKEVNGFEIINSQTLDQTSETIPQALEWWDRYNITGWGRYVGIGNSDGHKTYELGGSYNCLLIDELTEENIKNAFINGNLYFTTGPQLRYTLDGADMGGNAVVTTDNEKVSLEVTAYTPNGNPIEKVVVYRYAIGEDIDALYQAGRDNALVLYERDINKEDVSLFNYSGEIEVSAGEFVRVEVYAANDHEMVIGNYQMAMSNPIWVVSAEEKTLDHIEIKQDADKLVYNKGETLDTTGLKVNAVYTDGTESEVIDFTVSPAGKTLIEPGKHTVTISHRHFGVTETVSYDVTVVHPDGAVYLGNNCTEDPDTGYVTVEGGYYTQTAFTKFSEGEEATITISIEKFGNDPYDKNIWFTNGFAVTINPELSDSIQDSSLWDAVYWNAEPNNIFAYCFENHKTDGLKGSRCYPGDGTYSLSYVDWVKRDYIGDDQTVTIKVKKVNGVVTISFNDYAWDPHGTVTIPDGYLGIWVSENARLTVTNSETTAKPDAPVVGNGAGILNTLVNDKQGLRFNYTLTTTIKNGVETVALNGHTYTISKIGMLVSKDANATMTVGSTGVMNGYVTSARNIVRNGDQTTYTFSILVKNISKANKETNIYVRPYLLCDDGTILYGDTQSTNVYAMYKSLSATHDFDSAIDAWMSAGLLDTETDDDPYHNDNNWADGQIPPRN